MHSFVWSLEGGVGGVVWEDKTGQKAVGLRLQALQGRRKGKSVMKAKDELADSYALIGIILHPLDVNNIWRSQVVSEYI